MSEAEQQLAYHGPVRIHSWTDASKTGFRFKVELESREALEHFETATRRNSKRAGQRYRAVWQDADGQALATMPAELLFCGANWSHQAGATVTFTVSDEADEQRVKCQRTVDVDEDLAPRMFMGLVQLDGDDQPINQKKAGLADWADGLKGGPHSRAAAILCQAPDFQQFVGERLRLERPATMAECDRYIKTQCGIHTKRLLDHNDPRTGEPFWAKFERFVQRPFLSWVTRRGSAKDQKHHGADVREAHGH